MVTTQKRHTVTTFRHSINIKDHGFVSMKEAKRIRARALGVRTNKAAAKRAKRGRA